jgi:beta-lactamase superfamily II metal-dependent hydrolase
MKTTVTIDLKKIAPTSLFILLIFALFINNTQQNSLSAATTTQSTSSFVTATRWVPGTLEIHHIYVGQGDSVLLISPSGKTLLYDLGERDWPLHENADLVSQYISQVTGKKELDYLVLSHYHQDHVGNSKVTGSGKYDGGVFWLLKNSKLKVNKIIDRGFEPILPKTPIAIKYKEFVENEEGKKLIQRETAKLGTGQIDLGKEIGISIIAVNGKAYKDGKEITILPESEIKANIPPSENDLSLCLKISWNDFEYFLGGDLSGQEHESKFGYKYHDIESAVAEAVGNVEIYRVNHHGSDHSSNEKFINILDPEVSINSSGTANRFGHPRQSVIDRLLKTGDLFITGREGGVSTSDYKRSVEGGTVIVRAFNSGYNYEVSTVRSYRSYSDIDEKKRLDQIVDYEQERVRYEEANGTRNIDEDDEGTNSGDVKAGRSGLKDENSTENKGSGKVDSMAAELTEKNGFPRIRAKEHSKLEGYIGKKVYVWGKVTSTFTPASNKVKFLNVDTEDLSQSFTIVIFNKDWPAFFETPGIGDPCKYYEGKWIELKGSITAYEANEKNKEANKSKKLEMIVSRPDQIEVLPFREEGR